MGATDALLLDIEVPYADAELWRYWRKEERQALPEAASRPGSLRLASDGTQLLERAGFADVTVEGDHNHAEATSDDDFLVFVAKR